jgi:hypothetical protein
MLLLHPLYRGGSLYKGWYVTTVKLKHEGKKMTENEQHVPINNTGGGLIRVVSLLCAGAGTLQFKQALETAEQINELEAHVEVSGDLPLSQYSNLRESYNEDLGLGSVLLVLAYTYKKIGDALNKGAD